MWRTCITWVAQGCTDSPKAHEFALPEANPILSMRTATVAPGRSIGPSTAIQTKPQNQRANLNGSEHNGHSQQVRYPDLFGSSGRDLRAICHHQQLCAMAITRLKQRKLCRNRHTLNVTVWQFEDCLDCTDSGLEAFSLNPSDGGFATLARLLTTFTNCLNKLFLSY